MRFSNHIAKIQTCVVFKVGFLQSYPRLEEIEMKNVDIMPFRGDGDPNGPPHVALPLMIKRMAFINCKAFSGEPFVPKFDHVPDYPNLIDVSKLQCSRV